MHQLTCEHINIKRERMPSGHVHYGKILCADCNRFIGWEKSPANIAKEASNTEKIERLKGCAHSERVQSFLDSVTKQDGKLSPKQQAWLDSL